MTGSEPDVVVDRDVRDAMIVDHLGLADALASRLGGPNVDPEDLRAVAYGALCAAANRFEVARGVPFGGYAASVISGELRRWLRDRTWAVNVPRSLTDLGRAAARARDQLTLTLGRAPTITEIAVEVDASVSDLVEALDALDARTATSLDAPAGPSSSSSVGDGIGDADEAFRNAENVDLVDRLLTTLSARDREIVRLRYWEELPQHEIAERVGLSQIQISRILRQVTVRLAERGDKLDM